MSDDKLKSGLDSVFWLQGKVYDSHEITGEEIDGLTVTFYYRDELRKIPLGSANQCEQTLNLITYFRQFPRPERKPIDVEPAKPKAYRSVGIVPTDHLKPIEGSPFAPKGTADSETDTGSPETPAKTSQASAPPRPRQKPKGRPKSGVAPAHTEILLGVIRDHPGQHTSAIHKLAQERGYDYSSRGLVRELRDLTAEAKIENRGGTGRRNAAEWHVITTDAPDSPESHGEAA